jgi:hypothetical protein
MGVCSSPARSTATLTSFGVTGMRKARPPHRNPTATLTSFGATGMQKAQPHHLPGRTAATSP